MTDRTAEIWSTRLQRELLALTAPNSSEEDANSSTEKADDSSQGTVKHDNVNIAALPPYIKVEDHFMDIAEGVCNVTFSVAVDKTLPSSASQLVEGDLQLSEVNEVTSSGSTEEKDTDNAPETDKHENAVAEAETDVEPDSAEETLPEPPQCVLIKIDASMHTVGDSNPVCYPFLKPRVILAQGAELFSPNSTIKNNDPIDLDCDWTPSLHLSDAALNIALKIRESIRIGDAFHAASIPDIILGGEDNDNTATVKNILMGKNLSFPKMTMPTARKKDNAPLKKLVHISQIRTGDVIDLAEPPYSDCVGMYSCKAIRRPGFVELAIAEAETRAEASSMTRKLAEQEENEEEEIPSGAGNYMRLQAGGIRKVSVAGLVGAGSLFKSFVQSTKAVLEESFLMVTEEYILEVRTTKFAVGSANVTFISRISNLAKLKFRRQESISLFFKRAPDDPLILICHDSADAVMQIQNVLKKHGVRGKHSNAATQRAIQAALHLVSQIQMNEGSLNNDPSVEKVNEIMDLYRQAAEKFESAGDARHEEVMSHMHKFLAKPITVSILDGSHKASAKSAEPARATIASVPNASENAPDEDDDDDGLSKEEAKLSSASSNIDNSATSSSPQKSLKADESYDATMKQADDMLLEAKRDMENLSFDDDLDDFLSNATTSGGSNQEQDTDAVAELDAMLSAADKELDDIIEAK
mmetsp:Transcript_22509/g.32897  ORF Transcript_22509/g.32897 Transcript_22509/m.32897 type:complete len:697 (+) Transcript_22509:191-2281(+)|eukprot:CAMPEP_0195528036 /NCGR_PEP_ID=MMETSP0794_2-20130614/30007_1 /TAXON_ID=515487 /ORGANISM="Stephanopyxis turris, Strain CCMP 815" /LENGTH=696 /DNA_ID=CAMNT_0040659083 /DNA_START=184 /DNA_END=2274 /DNA_ORIENTATION=-